jgi:hypothetical protein
VHEVGRGDAKDLTEFRQQEREAFRAEREMPPPFRTAGKMGETPLPGVGQQRLHSVPIPQMKGGEDANFGPIGAPTLSTSRIVGDDEEHSQR